MWSIEYEMVQVSDCRPICSISFHLALWNLPYGFHFFEDQKISQSRVSHFKFKIHVDWDDANVQDDRKRLKWSGQTEDISSCWISVNMWQILLLLFALCNHVACVFDFFTLNFCCCCYLIHFLKRTSSLFLIIIEFRCYFKKIEKTKRRI